MIRVVSRWVVRLARVPCVLPDVGEAPVVGTFPQRTAGRPAQEQQGDQEVYRRPEAPAHHGRDPMGRGRGVVTGATIASSAEFMKGA